MYSGRIRSAWAQLAFFGAIVLFASQPAVAADKTDGTVFGYWKSIDTDTGKTQSIFRLWEDKGKLVGKILKTFPKAGEKQQTVCDECSGAQKGKPIEGLIFFWGFERDGGSDKKWIDGKVLNPGNGKTYNCEVELAEDGKTLKVYGYIRLLVKVGGTNIWQRPSAEELASVQGTPGA